MDIITFYLLHLDEKNGGIVKKIRVTKTTHLKKYFPIIFFDNLKIWKEFFDRVSVLSFFQILGTALLLCLYFNYWIFFLLFLINRNWMRCGACKSGSEKSWLAKISSHIYIWEEFFDPIQRIDSLYNQLDHLWCIQFIYTKIIL